MESSTQSTKGSQWFWQTLSQFKLIYLNVGIAAIITNLFVLAIPIYVMTVYDRVVPNYAITTLWVLFIGVIIIFIFDFIARTLRNYLIDIAGKGADEKLGEQLYKKLLFINMNYRPSSTGVITDYFHEFEALRDFFTSATLAAIIDLPFAILFLVVVWWIGGSLVFIPLVAIPILILLAFIFEIPTRSSLKASLDSKLHKQGILTETLSGLESIKILNAEPQMFKKWNKSISLASESANRSRFYASLAVNVGYWIQQIVVVSVVAYGVFLINRGTLTVGGLIAATILASRSVTLGHVSNILTRFIRSRLALSKLNEIMALPTDRISGKQYLKRENLKGDIHFEDVSFSYANTRTFALRQITFSISAGEHTGIIGAMGSGKSTLLKILIALYKPLEGSIFLDGTEYQEIDPIEIRKQIHYMGADNVLFNGTVRENILLANPNASEDDLLNAMKIAGVDKFTNKHEKGIDMEVGERGAYLSQGQRQAIVIAQGILAKPTVFLFDEPAAFMDQGSERAFLSDIKPILKDKTVLLVTNRASMLDIVDRLIVLDQGKIVADGTKAEILARLQANK